jgi:TRAP-type C4-dicarboxylate transport system substrate-binding protein
MRSRTNHRAALLGVIALALSGTVAACGDDDGGGNASASGGPSKASLSFSADYAAPPSPNAAGDQEWVDSVKAQSGGRIKITPTFNGTLVKAADVPTALASGELDLGAVNAPSLTGVLPDFGIVDVPFPGRTIDAAAKLTAPDTPLFKTLAEQASAKGLVLLPAGQMISGTTAIFTRKPITSLDQLKGMKIRSPGDVVDNTLLQGLGANPVALPPSDLVAALKTGTVDGALTSYTFANAAAKGLLKTAIPTGLSGSGYLVAASAKSWQELSPTDQKLIGTALRQAQEKEVGLLEGNAAKDAQAFADQGAGFVNYELTAADKAKIAQVEQPLCPKFKQQVSPEVFSAWAQTVEQAGMTAPCK